jgi:hypothetical protein
VPQFDVNPLELFKPTINGCTIPAPRWVHNTGKASVLIFTDGAAPSNGLPDARAGCGIVFRPDGQSSISFPLERSQDDMHLGTSCSHWSPQIAVLAQRGLCLFAGYVNGWVRGSEKDSARVKENW